MKKVLLIINIIIFYLLGLAVLAFYMYLELAPRVGMDEIDRIILLLLLALFCYLGTILLSKFLKNNKSMKIYLYGIFIIYIITLIQLTLFDSDYGRSGLNIFDWSKENLEVYLENNNLIPFKTISLYISRQDRVAIINLLGNLIAFAPMGIFLPLLFKKQNKLKKFILTNIAIILAIESLQFLSLSGHFDIDDLILCTLGMMLFYVIYNKTKEKFYVKRNQKK